MNVCQIWNLEQLITDRALSLLSEYTAAFHLMFSYNYIYPDSKFKFILSFMPRHGDKHSNDRGQWISLLNNRAAKISFLNLDDRRKGWVSILCSYHHGIHLPWERDAILSAQNKALWYCCCKHTHRQGKSHSYVGFCLWKLIARESYQC